MATLADLLRAGYVPPTDSALADPIKEHFRTLPQQLAKNQAAMDAAMGSWNKTDFATGQPNPNYRPEAIAELTHLMPNVGGLTAWHGTPHKIEGAFDISKVGTGEGAQAYGHGMYFAESPSVAESYKLAGAEKLKNPDAYAASVVKSYSNNPDKAIEVLQRIMPKKGQITYSGETPELIENAINSIKSGSYKNPELGNLYKVDIPDEYIPNMLDWDKPLSKQPKVVQDALAKIDPDLYHPTGGDYEPTELGQVIYHRLMNSPLAKNDVQASALLNNAGIKGIRYLDQGSRSVTGGELIGITKTPQGYVSKVKVENRGGAGFSAPTQQFTTSTPFKTEAEAQAWANEKIGGGTSNFVVFDPSTVKILEENSKPVSRKELIEKQVNKLKD